MTSITKLATMSIAMRGTPASHRPIPSTRASAAAVPMIPTDT